MYLILLFLILLLLLLLSLSLGVNTYRVWETIKARERERERNKKILKINIYEYWKNGDVRFHNNTHKSLLQTWFRGFYAMHFYLIAHWWQSYWYGLKLQSILILLYENKSKIHIYIYIYIYMKEVITIIVVSGKMRSKLYWSELQKQDIKKNNEISVKFWNLFEKIKYIYKHTIYKNSI